MKPCDYCGTPTAGQREHSEPRAHGGSDLPVNIAHACVYCNQEKSDRTLDEWAGDRVRVGLSWPPVSRAEFVDALTEAMNGASAEDHFLVSLLLEDFGRIVAELYRSARRSTAFTYESAAESLVKEARSRVPATA